MASDNAGCLFGRWIEALEDEAALRSEVAAMLRDSPEPGAEEWAIHDFEGFGGVEIREYESFANIVELAAFASEHGEFGAEILSYYGGDLEDARLEPDEMSQYEAFRRLAEEGRTVTEIARHSASPS